MAIMGNGAIPTQPLAAGGAFFDVPSWYILFQEMDDALAQYQQQIQFERSLPERQRKAVAEGRASARLQKQEALEKVCVLCVVLKGHYIPLVWEGKGV